MANEPLSALDAESGVVVEFVPATPLPSIPGGLRVVGLLGKGSTSKAQSASITRGVTPNGIDALSPAALSLPSTITDANFALYNLNFDYTLTLPTSVSATSAATTASNGDTLQLNINGDSVQTITFPGVGTWVTGAQVAAEIQNLVRSITAVNPANQGAYDNFTATFNAAAPNQYTLTSGTTPLGSVVVLGGNLAVPLKLGVANGGTETVGGNINWGPAAPAVFTGTVDVSVTAFPSGLNLDGQTFQIFINGSPFASSVTFVGTNLTAANIAAQLTAGLPGSVTATVFVSGLQNYIRITTVATSNASLQIGNGSANLTLGFVPGLRVAGPSEPAAGVKYNLTYQTPKVTADYSPQLFTSLDPIVTAYGTQTNPANTISVASNIVFQNSGGTGGIVAVQINPADGSDLAGFQNALNKLALVDGVNIVVALSVDPLLIPSIVSNVVNSSAPLEKKERTAIMGLPGNATVSSAIALAQSVASGGNGRRFMLVYPPGITSTVGGNEVALDGSFLAAAIAGLRINGNFDVAEPMLRKQLTSVDSAATNLLRSDKLRLRDGGVTVVEQINGVVRISEDTTTDRSTVDSQEFPITEIIDFVARTVRTLLDNIFVGIKILPDTPSIMTATIQVILNDFVSLNILNGFQNVSAVVDSGDPRQIDVSFEIQPVFGLRYILVKFSLTT